MKLDGVQEVFAAAVRSHQAGQLAEAEHLYRRVLSREPDHADAMHLLGVLQYQAGHPEDAVTLIQRAIDLRPTVPKYHNNLGMILRELGRLEHAEAACRQALSLAGGYAEAYNNLGNVLDALGRTQEAVAVYQEAVRLNPNVSEAWNNLGGALQHLGQRDDAYAAYRRALSLRPDYIQALNNLGTLLQEAGKFDQACDAFRRAIELRPDFADAYQNLGNALATAGRWDEAVVAYANAIKSKPDHAAAQNGLAGALKATGRVSEAIDAYRRAVAFAAENPEYRGNLIFTLQYDPDANAELIYKESRRFDEVFARALQSEIPARESRPAGQRLRIGYVSPDFWSHCQSFFTIPLLSVHDHERFEIFCYADVDVPDEVTARLRGHADVWRDIKGMSDHAVAEIVRKDRIDILVDLTMYMERGRPLLFARKPAPVQVAWLAYPGTTGLTAIDYRFTDPYLDPPGADESTTYSEASVHLPETFWCYDSLSDEPVGDPPSLRNGHVTFGCLNNFCKMNDGVLGLWTRVLDRAAGSRLLLLAPEGNTRSRIIADFAKCGIDPGRVEFVGYQSRTDYLRTYHRIDVALDTVPYNGHTTTLDALWMGVPVVTLVGSRVVGRAGWSQLSNLGLTELAAGDVDAYVHLAATLASDSSRLANLRKTLRERMKSSPLMDGTRFARAIERTYERLWSGYGDGRTAIGSGSEE